MKTRLAALVAALLLPAAPAFAQTKPDVALDKPIGTITPEVSLHQQNTIRDAVVAALNFNIFHA